MSEIQTRTRARRRQPPLPGSGTSEALVGLAFFVAMLAGLGLVVVYILGGQNQLEGILLFLAFGGIGFGIVLWSQELLALPEVTEPRHPFATPDSSRVLTDLLLEERGITRRLFLIGGLFSAIGALGLGLIAPLFSLGPLPGRDFFVTPWKKGLRLIRDNGQLVHPSDLEVGGILTVFPEGHAGEADAATVLIRLDPGQLQPPTSLSGAPDGFVAYSKLCTHAGCPVGLYRASQAQLICPCHQSTFDVARGAVPIFGPAGRPLPQLPIAIQTDGTFVATGPFPRPVGPSFWNVYDESTQQ